MGLPTFFAFLIAPAKKGNKNAIRITMIAMTTIISIRDMP
jgi:hypothetical protein